MALFLTTKIFRLKVNTKSYHELAVVIHTINPSTWRPKLS